MQLHSLYSHNNIIYAYSYYLCRATSHPNVRQHHLPNLDPPPQLPTFGSTSSIVGIMYPLKTWAPCVVSMGMDSGLRSWCYLPLPNCRPCISSLLSTFDDIHELHGSHRKMISPTFTKNKICCTWNGDANEIMNKESIDQNWRLWIISTCMHLILQDLWSNLRV